LVAVDAGVGVSVGNIVFVAIGLSVAVAVEASVGADAQEDNRKTMRISGDVLIFIFSYLSKKLPN